MKLTETIIDRQDGSQIKVIAKVLIGAFDVEYSTEILLKDKNSWKPLLNLENDWRYRELSMDERNKFVEAKNKEFLGEAQYREILQKAWESIKPQELRDEH